jgi:hypothetical protein
MLDFAVYPQLVFGYLFGLEQQLTVAMHPIVKALGQAWLGVTVHLRTYSWTSSWSHFW